MQRRVGVVDGRLAAAVPIARPASSRRTTCLDRAGSCGPRQLVDRGAEEPGQPVGRGHERPPQHRSGRWRPAARLGQQRVCRQDEPSPGPFVATPGRRRATRRHGRPGLGEAERDALAGQRVDVAGGVADQQHPAGDPARGTRCRSGPAPSTRERPAPRQPLAPARGSCASRSSKSAAGRRPSTATPTRSSADRRHVGLAPRGASAPRRTSSTARSRKCRRSPYRRRARRAAVEPEPAGGPASAGRRRRRGSAPRSPSTSTPSPRPGVTSTARPAARRATPAAATAVGQGRVQRGAPDAAARAGRGTARRRTRPPAT